MITDAGYEMSLKNVISKNWGKLYSEDQSFILNQSGTIILFVRLGNVEQCDKNSWVIDITWQSLGEERKDDNKATSAKYQPTNLK